MTIKKLDFSQFHPLDHPIWHPRCRQVTNFPEAPQGWPSLRIHFCYWKDFVWRDAFAEAFPEPKSGKIDWEHYVWAVRNLLWWNKPS